MHITNIMYAFAGSLFCLLITMPNQAIAEQSLNETVIRETHNSIIERLSPEEKKWFARFQKGTFFAKGWQGISADILEKTPDELRPQQRVALESLGYKIGSEWSKDNEVRKIDTDMLRQWADQLKTIAGQDPTLLPRLIAELDQQVAMLLD